MEPFLIHGYFNVWMLELIHGWGGHSTIEVCIKSKMFIPNCPTVWKYKGYIIAVLMHPDIWGIREQVWNKLGFGFSKFWELKCSQLWFMVRFFYVTAQGDSHNAVVRVRSTFQNHFRSLHCVLQRVRFCSITKCKAQLYKSK